ncbi:M23 family metallopeptidase [Aliiglaciecola litoralis]|uniref:M23ase beta-sheet core domain-containing protein n=1 Tax=Aliiglaciecola litoralis TaxID=582857 RepID=A0ABP3WPP5_9ALTE
MIKGFEKLKVLSLQSANKQRAFYFGATVFNWSPGNMYAQHNDQYRYSLPYAANQKYPIVQGYGGGWSHNGASKYALDFDMPIGTPVHAAREGTVIDLTQHHRKGGAHRRFAKYANFVTVLHDDDTTGEYYHLRYQGAAVKVGDKVLVGDLIGYSGNTGFSSMPHLHFAVYKAKSHGKFESIPVQFNSPVFTQRSLKRSK